METSTHGYGITSFPKFGEKVTSGPAAEAAKIINNQFTSLSGGLRTQLKGMQVPAGNQALVTQAWIDLVAAHDAFINAYGGNGTVTN